MKILRIAAIAALMALALPLAAQEQTAEQQEKALYEMIQTQIDNMEKALDLEDWQIFYVDSILTHDYRAMQAELIGLRNSKISSQDRYYRVQDKWNEQIYNAIHGVLDEPQWQKYLKSGAAREKKNRDKRAAKKGE
ncbi:MAG: hypothetical protein J6W83_03665 [Bacteroidales bacterium]|nr:hypothetical protein [Bacteroidales bacterium]